MTWFELYALFGSPLLLLLLVLAVVWLTGLQDNKCDPKRADGIGGVLDPALSRIEPDAGVVRLTPKW
jgi:hypothetical protein